MKERKVAPRACDPASPRVAKMPPPPIPPMPIEKAPTTPMSRGFWPVPAPAWMSRMFVPASAYRCHATYRRRSMPAHAGP